MKKTLAFRKFYKFFTASQKEKEDAGWSSKTIVHKEFQIGQYSFTYERRSKEGFMGRFGGGWQYKLGIDIGGSTVILNLLIASLRIGRIREGQM